MFDVRVHGANELARVGRLVKEAGDKDLKREFFRALNSSVKPLTASVKEETPRYMPARYAALLQRDLKVRTRRRTSQRNPALYLVGQAKRGNVSRDIRSLERGRLRHPLFGDRSHWYDQTVNAGWWTGPLNAGADVVRRELVQALERIAAKVTS